MVWKKSKQGLTAAFPRIPSTSDFFHLSRLIERGTLIDVPRERWWPTQRTQTKTPALTTAQHGFFALQSAQVSLPSTRLISSNMRRCSSSPSRASGVSDICWKSGEINSECKLHAATYVFHTITSIDVNCVCKVTIDRCSRCKLASLNCTSVYF